MDLWIRSQDKTDLRKVRKVVYLEPGMSLNLPSGETIENDNYLVMVDGYCLGNYKTQERALEVLNEIQELLTDRICFDNYNSLNLIYEMPQE